MDTPRDLFEESEETKTLRPAILKAITFGTENFKKLITKLSEEEREMFETILENILLDTDDEYNLRELFEEYFQHLKEDLKPEEKLKADYLAKRIQEEGLICNLSLEDLFFIFSNKSVLKKCLIAKFQGMKKRVEEMISEKTLEERVLEIHRETIKGMLKIADISEEEKQKIIQLEKLTQDQKNRNMESLTRSDKEHLSKIDSLLLQVIGLFSPKLN